MKLRTFHVVWLVVSALAVAAPAAGGTAPNRPQTASSNSILQNDEAHFGRSSSSPDGSGRAPVVILVDGGFDWVSAGVGAAGTLGLIVLAGVGASALRRRLPRPV